MSDQSQTNITSPVSLRRFGWSLGLLLGVVFGALLPYLLGYQLPVWPWFLTAGLIAMAELAPHRLAVIHTLWFRLADLLHRLFSPVLLGIIFFGLVFPIGWLKRSLGQSKIQTRLEPDVSSYRESPITSDDLKDPF